jgi:putative Ca2+/H+ antiporter (TMEM165/GDT1 family)
MMDPLLAGFATVASALFVAELTDKDALLVLMLSTRVDALRVFLAGASAFVFTSAVIVTLGTFLVRVAPIFWIRMAGGAVMVSYGLWEARGLAGEKAVVAEEQRLEKSGVGLRAFLAMVGALVLLDLAGDATEVLTLVFVAQYPDPWLVFAGACAGLIAATALETVLGSRLRGILTRRRLRYLSMAIFLVLGSAIILAGAL